MNKNRVAVVTGAARGIGAATAARFVSEAYEVIGLDVLQPEKPAEWRINTCDVTDEGAVARLIGGIEREFGRIDVLANVAGVVLVKPLTETKWEDFQRIVNVNLGGTFLLLKYVLPIMQRQ